MTKPKTKKYRWNSTIAIDPEAKRLPRSTKPPRKRNSRRAAKRERERYGEHAAWIRMMPCFVCAKAGIGQRWTTVAAHAGKTQGAGGKQPDIVDMCWMHEMAWHNVGRRTFDRTWDVNCKARAAYLWSISPHNPENEQ